MGETHFFLIFNNFRWIFSFKNHYFLELDNIKELLFCQKKVKNHHIYRINKKKIFIS